MRNSADPTTSEFAARLAGLCDGPPVIHDLDVLRSLTRTPEPRGAMVDA